MIDVEVITLEDNKEYYILREIDNYLYLVNTEDENDITIRKNVKSIDGKNYVQKLESEEELNKALNLFQNN